MPLEIDRMRVVVFPDGRLDTMNAACFLGLSVKTLATMRSMGTGPRYIKRGRIFYFLEDLRAWIAENPRVQSTAQARLASTSPTRGVTAPHGYPSDDG